MTMLIDPAPRDKSHDVLVLLEAGYEQWQILGPAEGFGNDLHIGDMKDRRYQVLCTIKGDFWLAMKHLTTFERGWRDA